MSFGPHRFRHSVATTIALRLGGPPQLAAAVLGNTPATVEGSYNRSGQCQAAARYAALIAKLRRKG